MVSAKLTTLDLLKIKVFSNKDYDVIISIHDVTSKILSRESNYTVDMVKVHDTIHYTVQVHIHYTGWPFSHVNIPHFHEIIFMLGPH